MWYRICYTACNECHWFQCEEHSETQQCCLASAQQLQALSLPDLAEHSVSESHQDQSRELESHSEHDESDGESASNALPPNSIHHPLPPPPSPRPPTPSQPRPLGADCSSSPPTVASTATLPVPIPPPSKRKRSATTLPTEEMTDDQLEDCIRKTAQKVEMLRRERGKEQQEPTPSLAIPGATRKGGIVSAFFKENSAGCEPCLVISHSSLFCFSCRHWSRTNASGEESKTRAWNNRTINVGTMILVGTAVCTFSIRQIFRHHLCRPR